MEKSLVKHESTTAALWADRSDVREIAERLQTMMPGAQKLTPTEALALAQAAVAHQLDPFNGEIWLIPGSGLMAGIKGHRRAAHQQIKTEGGGNYWPEFQMLDQDEKAALGIPTGALAYRCKVRDTQTVNEYTSQIERLLDKGLPWEIVSDIVGAKPYTEGIGYAEKTERSKMTLVQRAMKRAEADALKRRFDLPFGSAVGGSGDTDSDIIEGEFVTGEDEPRLTQATAERAKAMHDKLEANRSILRGENLDIGEAEPEHAFADERDPVINAAQELGAEVVEPDDWPAVNSPIALLEWVDEARGDGYGGNIHRLLNAIAQELGEGYKWPTANDTAGWREAQEAAFRHVHTSG